LLRKENLFKRKERKEAQRKRKENLKEKAASFNQGSENRKLYPELVKP
jgi:hypothetical protein